MSKFYRKNQDIPPVVKAEHVDREEWMREPAESRVRSMKDLFPEPKTRRLQPISRDIGRGQRRQVQTPCVNCRCKDNMNQISLSQQEQFQQRLREAFGQSGVPPEQSVQIQATPNGEVVSEIPSQSTKKFAPKNV